MRCLPSHRIAGLVAVFAALVLGLSACGAAAAPSTSTQTLTIALPAGYTISSWFPLVPPSDCINVNGPGGLGPDTYKPLVWVSNADTLDFTRSIASKITVSRNDTLYTVTMNPKWHWNDGRPVTAADAAYDIQLFLAASAPTSPYPYCFSGSGGVPADWGKVTVLGPYKFSIQTTHPVNPAWFERNGLGQIVPIPKFAWDKYSSPTQELSWMKAVSNQPGNPIFKVADGPYIFSREVPDEYWLFDANPHYDGAHKPTFRTIRWDYETSGASIFLALKKGTVQVATIPMSYLGPIKKLTNYRVVVPHLFGFQWLGLNFRSSALGVGALFNKLYIRQALQMGINQAAIVTINHGYATRVIGPVPSQPHNIFYDYKMPVYYPYDPARGKALLERHGWHEVNGVMEKSGKKLAFDLLDASGGSSVTTQHEFDIIQAGWAKEGIQAKIYTSSLPTTVGHNWAASGFGDWFYAPVYYPSGGDLFASTGGINQAGGFYNNPEMNRLIAATYAPGTLSQTIARMYAYQEYAAQQLPVLWVPVTPAEDGFMYAVAKSVTGFARNYNDLPAYVSYNMLK